MISMALNSDQLLDRFLKMRYTYNGTCRIEREKVKALRQVKEKKLREQMKGVPEKNRIELLNQLIEKENAISEESR